MAELESPVGCEGCRQYVDQVRQTIGLVGQLAWPRPTSEA